MIEATPAQPAEQSAAAGLLPGAARRQHRDGVGLDVVDVVERAQMGDQLVFVARRQQRGQQDDVRHACRQRRHRGVAGVDHRHFDPGVLLENGAKQRPLAGVGFERKDERHAV